MTNRLDSVLIKNEKWQFIQKNNNTFGSATFEGKPFPSITVLNLIGSSGVRDIDSIIKEVRISKIALFGNNSPKSKLDSFQYFIKHSYVEKYYRTYLQKLFRSNQVIICGGCFDFDFFGDKYNDFKKDNWGEIGSNIVAFRDYIIYTPHDTNVIKRKINNRLVKFKHEYEEIIDGDTYTINN